MKRIDIRGTKFHSLTVLDAKPKEVYSPGGSKKLRWLCRCECGNEKFVDGNDLRRGATKSCGCMRAKLISDSKVVHGYSKRSGISPTYKVWQAMKRRCDDPNVKCFKNYGERGITYDQRWANFEPFLADMGEAPKGKQLDRIDNDGPYCKSNCRWATVKEQALNKRNTVSIKYRGTRMLVEAVAEKTGLSPSTIRQRIKYGWTDKQVVELPKWRKAKWLNRRRNAVSVRGAP